MWVASHDVVGCVTVSIPAEGPGAGSAGSVDRATRAYGLLVDDEEAHGCGDLPPEACREVPGNAIKLVTGLTLQKIGDRVVDAKTVLTWLLSAVGAPAFLTGLLVPVRESGSLLPQTLLVPWVRTHARRAPIWIIGSFGQFAAVVAMAVLAVTTTGAIAGAGIVAALAIFALSRSLASIASKDVLGRTIPKGARGQVTGTATVASGLVAITVGLGIRLLGGDDVTAGVFAVLLGIASLFWVAAAGVYAAVEEPEGEHDDALDVDAARRAAALLRDDRAFRRFVIARTLLLVSALAPPFVVTLATRETGLGFSRLGPFLIAQGIASLLGGRVWGRWADRSSRLVIMAAAGIASGLVLLFLVATTVPAVVDQPLLYPVTYFLLALAHTGARIGRKTYVVDLAEGNQRTDYVAVSNTAMGLLLLVTGAVSAGLAGFGPRVALLFLAALGAAGVPVARRLPEVSAGRR